VPQLDIATFAPQLIWLAITFILLYLLMAKVALPRVATVLEERTKRIEANLEKAESLKQEAEVAREAYEKAVAESHAKASALIAQTNERAAKEAADRQQALAVSLAAKGRDTEERIASARTKALESTPPIAAEVAREAVRKLLGREVDDASAQAAVKAALAKAH
jgi:F-type H+-transporting ATPase subunit b